MTAPENWTADMLAVRVDEIEKRIDENFVELDARLAERWRAQEKSFATQTSNQQHINERQNEFRGALKDQAQRVEQQMMPRTEYDERHRYIEAEITRLRNDMLSSRDEHGDLLPKSEYVERHKQLELEVDRLKDDLTAHEQESKVTEATLRHEIAEQPRRDASKRRSFLISALVAIATTVYVIVAIITLFVQH